MSNGRYWIYDWRQDFYIYLPKGFNRTAMDKIENKLKHTFPSFNKSTEFISKLIETGQQMNVPADTAIIGVGEYIKIIPFLIDGLIKIYREDESGNEIFLYYITSGESCVMSITTCLKNEKGSIKALVVEDSDILAVPVDAFINLLNEYNLLQTFTYDLFRSKFNELIKSIDNLAFTDIKSRLMQYLRTECEVKGVSIISGLTHKKIANDLATSREVISRTLSLLQREGYLILEQRKITLTSKTVI